MAQPLLIRSSLSVALITALQFVLPGMAVAALLLVLCGPLSVDITPYLTGLAATSWLLVGLTIRPSSAESPELRFNPYRLAVSVFARWIALALALIAIGYLSGLAPNYPRRLILAWIVLSPVLSFTVAVMLQIVLRTIALSRENQRTAVIVGVTQSSVSLATKLEKHPEFCSRVLGFFEDRGAERLDPMGDFRLIGRLNELAEFVRREGVDVIFISLPIRHVERVMRLLDELRDSTASIYYVPDIFVFDLIQSRTAEIEGIPVVAMCETPFYGYRGVLKRVTDLALTCGLLVAALPVMIVLGLLVKLTSRGPVIFRQRRYGLDGEEIVVYKFRSMRVADDAGSSSVVAQARRDDPRVTPIGRFIRKYSLDEIPQLINVLQGRMSLVGPRPHAVSHNEMYRGLIKGYMVRHKVLPGITGLAQVSGCRGETQELAEMEARVRYDLEYLRSWSPALDLRILLLTLRQLLGDKKAY